MKTTNVADAVLKAALDLFSTQGYATTSVQQIVESAGVTKGAMYHYFQSKDDLLFAIYDRMLTLQKRRLDEIVTQGGATIDVVRAVCVDVVETSIDLLPEGTVFFRSMHMLTPDRHQEVTSRRREYHDEFAALIAQGQAEGVVRTDVPRSVLIAHFYSDVHYLSYWYSPSGPETKSEVANQLADLFLRSITVEDR
ncbi:TetR/AcrR family transcriptional regulator [Isoptericola jiangsuensis]|uniref:TetR/AcrR family transcriptional regulator n=1 Tax=Isoptericola jiangsuensis TaxID=548579 RepID=UPI003AAB6848